MPLEIFGAIALPLLTCLQRGEDGGAVLPRSSIVGVDVVDVHEHSVDDVGDLQPLACGLAFLAVPPRSVVVGRRSGEHDHAAVGLHLTVAQATALTEHPGAPAEPKDARQPVHRPRPGSVRAHRDDPGSLPPATSFGRYSPNTPRRTRQHSPIVTYSARASFSGGIRFSDPRAARSTAARSLSTTDCVRRARSFFKARACAAWWRGLIFM